MKYILESNAEQMECPFKSVKCTICQCMAWENQGDTLIENGESNRETIAKANEYGRCKLIP